MCVSAWVSVGVLPDIKSIQVFLAFRASLAALHPEMRVFERLGQCIAKGARLVRASCSVHVSEALKP